MPHYRVQLHGSGISIPSPDGGDSIVGFYTTRVVTASSEEAAAEHAIQRVTAQWAAPPLSAANAGASPTLSVEWVRRTSLIDRLTFRGNGHTFYTVDDDAV